MGGGRLCPRNDCYGYIFLGGVIISSLLDVNRRLDIIRSRALKSVNLKILLFENGRLPTLEGRQNEYGARRALILFSVTVTDKRDTCTKSITGVELLP